MIKPHIKEGIKGHAMPIVAISEGSKVDRAIFNCITHILHDRPCESTEEIDKVWEVQCDLEDQIMALLKAMPAVSGEGHPTEYRLVEG